MYIHYGDDMILKNSYEPIKKWLDWLEIQADNFIIEYGVIGDWIPPAEYGIEGSAGSGAASTNTPPATVPPRHWPAASWPASPGRSSDISVS